MQFRVPRLCYNLQNASAKVKPIQSMTIRDRNI